VNPPATYELFKVVRDLFSERPIMSRILLEQNLRKLNSRTTIAIISCLAYNYSNGPFRTFWVRFGYDPSKMPESVSFQLIDYRIRQRNYDAMIPVVAKRTSYNRLPANYAEKNHCAYERKHFSGRERSGYTRHRRVNDDDDSDVYVFRQGTLPAYRQVYYQMCDVEMDAVKKLLDTCRSSKFTERDGWLLDGTVSRIRDLMDTDVKTTAALLFRDKVRDNPAETTFRRAGRIYGDDDSDDSDDSIDLYGHEDDDFFTFDDEDDEDTFDDEDDIDGNDEDDSDTERDAEKIEAAAAKMFREIC